MTNGNLEQRIGDTMKEKIKWQLESLQSKEAKDWLKLMIEAKKAGITKEEVRAFILRNKISRT